MTSQVVPSLMIDLGDVSIASLVGRGLSPVLDEILESQLRDDVPVSRFQSALPGDERKKA